MSETDEDGKSLQSESNLDDKLCFEEQNSEMIQMRQNFKMTVIKGMNVPRKIKWRLIAMQE